VFDGKVPSTDFGSFLCRDRLQPSRGYRRLVVFFPSFPVMTSLLCLCLGGG